MKRKALHDLQEWRYDEHRKPLIIRGARQVGKSWLVREFANEFDEFIEVNFERLSEKGIGVLKLVSIGFLKNRIDN